MTIDFDVQIKNGTIVDGTRVPRFRGDLWIKDGRIAQIGGRPQGASNQVLDAEGCIVAPGFIDLHTHYDAQIRWDPYCTISGWHTASLRSCWATVASASPRASPNSVSVRCSP